MTSVGPRPALSSSLPVGLLLALAMLAALMPAAAAARTSLHLEATYDVTATVIWASRKLKVVSRMDVTNTSGPRSTG